MRCCEVDVFAVGDCDDVMFQSLPNLQGTGGFYTGTDWPCRRRDSFLRLFSSSSHLRTFKDLWLIRGQEASLLPTL